MTTTLALDDFKIYVPCSISLRFFNGYNVIGIVPVVYFHGPSAISISLNPRTETLLTDYSSRNRTMRKQFPRLSARKGERF